MSNLDSVLQIKVEKKAYYLKSKQALTNIYLGHVVHRKKLKIGNFRAPSETEACDFLSTSSEQVSQEIKRGYGRMWMRKYG